MWAGGKGGGIYMYIVCGLGHWGIYRYFNFMCLGSQGTSSVVHMLVPPAAIIDVREEGTRTHARIVGYVPPGADMRRGKVS